MKRNKNLQPLSRDHFQTLTLVQKIEESLEGDITSNLTDIIEYVHGFWQKHLTPHFKAEEDFLLSAFALRVGEDNSLIERTLHDHRNMKAIHQSFETTISQEEGVRLLKEFASLLHDHIRFEERELFPAVEKQLTKDELESMGVAIEKSHVPPSHEPFPSDRGMWPVSSETRRAAH